MSDKPLIAGNWKMHTVRDDAVALAKALADGLGGYAAADVAVFPPFTVLYPVVEVLHGSAIQVGSQDIAIEDKGAFTGEVSGPQIKDTGASLVLVGHSERRHVIGETDVLLRKKVEAALRNGLCPVLCVGERLDERESGKTFDVIQTQLVHGLEGLDRSHAGRLTVAYEPVWAIGTGKTATPEQAEEVHRFIRGRLDGLFGPTSCHIRILYGGSVKPSNAKALLGKPSVQGLLVGGASLDAKGFVEIARSSG